MACSIINVILWKADFTATFRFKNAMQKEVKVETDGRGVCVEVVVNASGA